jgi:hypothetical protein
MPSTQPRTTDRPGFQMTPERVRTGIIVSVVIATLSLLILGYVLLKRRMNRGVKEGKIRNRAHDDEDPRIKMVDKELETGVISEPLPVYKESPREDEKRMMAAEDGFERQQLNGGFRFPSGHP